jgi:tetratricopeptide (TPR) repeat protein
VTALLLVLLLGSPQESAQRLRAGQEKIKARDFDGAIPEFQRCLELQPEEYDASFGLGVCFWEKEEFRKAKEQFARVVELVEKSKPGAALPGVHQKLLGCALLLEDFEAAVAEATRLLEIQPTGEYFYARALARQRKGELDAALDDASKAVQEDGLLVKARTLRASLLLSKGQAAPAMDEFAAAIRAKPSEREGYLGRAAAHYRLEHWAEAAGDLQSARKANRGHNVEDLGYTTALAWLALTRGGRKDAAQAEVDAYRASLKEFGKDPSKSHLLSLPLYLAAELSEADLLRAADGVPGRKRQARCETSFFVGERKLLAGDKAGAREAFRKAVETGARGNLEYDLAEGRLRALGE